MLITEGGRSGGYSGNEACCPAFPVPELGRMTTPEHTSPESAKFHQSYVVRIDWPVGSSDMSTIEHVKDIFGQRVRHIILALINISMRRYRRNRGRSVGTKSHELCETNSSPNLRLKGDTYVDTFCEK